LSEEKLQFYVTASEQFRRRTSAKLGR